MSLSASPAFGPCGMPEELEPEEPDPLELDDPELPEVAAGRELEEEDGEPPPPQPATPIAISTRVATRAAGRRGEPNKASMFYLSVAWCLVS